MNIRIFMSVVEIVCNNLFAISVREEVDGTSGYYAN